MLPAIIKDDEIDLLALMLQIWNERWVIVKTVGVFLLLGLVVALTSSSKYTSAVTLIPDANRGLSLGNLGGIAAQFGLGNLAGNLDEGAIPTAVYPDIIYSVPFMKSLMQYEVVKPGTDSTISLYSYFKELQEASFSNRVRNFIKTMLGFIGFNFDENVALETRPGHANTGVITLTETELAVLEDLTQRISFEVTRNPEMINMAATMPDPVLAAAVANRVAELLSEFVIKFRTDKARMDLEFVMKRHDEARERFEVAQEQLALFRDASHGRLTAVAQTEDQRLQREYDLSFTIFNTLARQLEENQLRVQEETPVVSVIQPAVVPLERSAPRRKIIMIISGFLGGVAGIGIIFSRILLGSMRRKIVGYEG